MSTIPKENDMLGRSLLNRREILRMAGLGFLASGPVGRAELTRYLYSSTPRLNQTSSSTDTIHNPTRTGVQDFANEAPADLLIGPFVMQGQVVYRAIDGSWIEFIAQSNWGSFTYVITCIARENGNLPRLAETPVAPSDVQISRNIPWMAIRTGKSPLWLEGAITRKNSDGTELEGTAIFKDEIVRLRFQLIENYLRGADPAPNIRNLYYGPHVRQKLDVYLTKSTAPAPVAVYFHGGGWQRGDKSDLRGHHLFLDAGISVVAVDYRYLPPDNPNDSTPAVALPLRDAARALQFIRSKAAEWNLSKDKVGVWGVSAGAYSSLWLGTHPEMADTSSPDPVARESTRPVCVSAIAPQTSLDPEQMRAWVGPALTYGPQAFGIHEGFDAFLADRKKLLPWIREFSPAALVSRSSAPMFLDYRNIGLTPFEPLGGYYTHSPRFGIGFLGLARKVGAECYLHYEGHEAEQFGNWHQFLVDKLSTRTGHSS